MRVGPCMVLIWDGKIRRAFMVCEKYQVQYLFKLQGGKYSKWKCWSSLQTWISKHETNLELIGYSTYHSILHLLEPFRGVSAKGLIFRTIYICRASEDWKKMSLWKKSILLKPSTFGLSFVVEPKSIHFQAQKHHHITTTHTYKQHTIIIRICFKKKNAKGKTTINDSPNSHLFHVRSFREGIGNAWFWRKRATCTWQRLGAVSQEGPT